ncbi:acyl-CoA thioesterase [Olivibacter sp. SA151]|uniref:acyl-CoA thioesterase n=1 Tax=Olivibacter jilunii TaxID=985016 RepID=UPI003F136C2E
MTENQLANFAFSTSIQIRFVDLDAFRHVNNANYLTYCEIARTIYWNQKIKWNWNTIGVIIARAEVDYLSPLTLKNNLRVYIRTSKVGNKSFELEYLMISKRNWKLTTHAKAKTVCVCIDYRSNETVLIPEKQKKLMLQELNHFVNKGS